MRNDTKQVFNALVQSTKTGDEYNVAHLMSISAGINPHISDLNIVSDREFKSSNTVFKATLKYYRKSGKETSVHYPCISEFDLETIRNSAILSPNSPVGLVEKVHLVAFLCESHPSLLLF